ncbi:type VI secretion system contractile sheath large subunit [bacterium]|nr:type VI secretion system contractile sheath large subunit [bacterium]
METFDFTFGPSRGARRETDPFVIGVLADLGAPGERRFRDVDVDSFDARLAALGPRLAFSVPDTVRGGELEAALAFGCLEDFEPAAIVTQVPLLSTLWAARSRLAVAVSRPDGRHANGAPDPVALLAEALGDASLAEQLLGRPAAAAPAQDDFARLMGETPDHPTPAPTSPVDALVRQAMAGTPTVSAGAAQTVEFVVERLDAALGDLLSAILHHEAFQRLEAAWRGLHYLVSNSDTDELLRIRFLSLTREELAGAVAAPLDECILWRLVRDGSITSLVVDGAFDHADVGLLRALGAMAPCLAAASPSVLGLASWQGLAVTRERIAGIDEAWRAFQQTRESARVSLTLPRVLARLPYGRKSNPAEGIAFEERVDPSAPETFVWFNGAYALATVLARAFGIEGWDARFEAGRGDCVVDGLPFYTVTNAAGDTEILCPTEVAIPVEHGVALANCGLSPLLHKKNTDQAIFVAVPPLK